MPQKASPHLRRLCPKQCLAMRWAALALQSWWQNSSYKPFLEGRKGTFSETRPTGTERDSPRHMRHRVPTGVPTPVEWKGKNNIERKNEMTGRHRTALGSWDPLTTGTMFLRSFPNSSPFRYDGAPAAFSKGCWIQPLTSQGSFPTKRYPVWIDWFYIWGKSPTN